MNWLDRLKMGRGRPRGRTEAEPAADDTPHAHLAWLDGERSPFAVPVLDCRDFCRTMVSVTTDPERAARFVKLRGSTGEEHRGHTPANAMCIASLLSYPMPGRPPDGPLFRAEEMEDKWDIFLFDQWFYFARSWTGELVFRAEVRFTGTQAIVSNVEADAKLASSGDLAVRQVDFLIKSHLLGEELPHPLPPDLPDDPLQIAAYSLSWYGRHAAYATYTDTTRFGRKFDPDETLR